MTILRHARSNRKWDLSTPENGHKSHSISEIRIIPPQKQATHTNPSKFINKFFVIDYVKSLTEVNVNRVNLRSSVNIFNYIFGKWKWISIQAATEKKPCCSRSMRLLTRSVIRIQINFSNIQRLLLVYNSERSYFEHF